jgi:flagellar hook-length control protein FliK
MKQRLKSDEIAALAGKNLPEVMAPPVVAKSRNLTRLAVRPATTIEGDVALATSSSVRMRPLSSQSAATDAAPASPVARLFNGILEEATIVRRLRPDSLSVVIKPDSQTEIFVRLEMRDGRLEAAARCDRGDYQFLSAHWPELRQSLQHQGVRLQDLQQRPEGLSLNPGNLGSSSQQRRQTSTPETEITAITPAATRSKPTVLTARSAAKALAGKRLLESWA